MLIVWALALLAADAPAVRVAPADPTAPFKGDGGALKFDPSCRDYTVDTLSADPACANRVADGEAAPSLAVAVRTFSADPARAPEASRLLDRAIAQGDHPALRYFLGLMWGTGERLRPDYARAVSHLSVGAERGNPAAADLLASLIVAGKGAPRDMGRAVALLERAAANGFPTAAVTLGKLHLAGTLVPRDPARGLAWLKAAAAAGAPGAANLAALAEGDAKVNNFQLVPAPDPRDVKAVRYGTFDNPDIPPSFGYDEKLQALHRAPYDDAATLAALERDAASRPTPYLYELARRLATHDPDRALRTYLVARTRMGFDALRCADGAALEAVRAWDLLVAPDLRFLLAGGPPAPAIVAAALADEATLPDDAEPWWVCRSGMAEMSAALAGKVGPLRLKPRGEWPALREQARAPLRALVGRAAR